MTDFNKLALASHMKCVECKTFADIYISTQNFVRLNILREDKPFMEMVLNDFKAHIFEKHPNRAEAFLKGE